MLPPASGIVRSSSAYIGVWTPRNFAAFCNRMACPSACTRSRGISAHSELVMFVSAPEDELTSDECEQFEVRHDLAQEAEHAFRGCRLRQVDTFPPGHARPCAELKPERQRIGGPGRIWPDRQPDHVAVGQPCRNVDRAPVDQVVTDRDHQRARPARRRRRWARRRQLNGRVALIAAWRRVADSDGLPDGRGHDSRPRVDRASGPLPARVGEILAKRRQTDGHGG